MNISRATAAIKKLVRQNGVSVEEARREMKRAIEVSMASDDPAVEAYWAAIPRKGEKPTPEEVIIYAAGKVRNGI